MSAIEMYQATAPMIFQRFTPWCQICTSKSSVAGNSLVKGLAYSSSCQSECRLRILVSLRAFMREAIKVSVWVARMDRVKSVVM